MNDICIYKDCKIRVRRHELHCYIHIDICVYEGCGKEAKKTILSQPDFCPECEIIIAEERRRKPKCKIEGCTNECVPARFGMLPRCFDHCKYCVECEGKVFTKDNKCPSCGF